MSKVKICGVRRQEDIEMVNRYIPEFVGFVFAKSKRQVSFEQVETLIGNLDKRIKKAGVFVNEEKSNILEAIGRCKLDVIQLHGDETPEYVDELRQQIHDKTRDLSHINGETGKVQVWKALRVKDQRSLEMLGQYRVDAFLLDTFVEGAYGGAGKTFDWNLAADAKKHGKIVLAGGLAAHNVYQAIKTVGPYCVDVSSSVESEGFKDEAKVQQFICKVRSYH